MCLIENILIENTHRTASELAKAEIISHNSIGVLDNTSRVYAQQTVIIKQQKHQQAQLALAQFQQMKMQRSYIRRALAETLDQLKDA